MTGLSDPQREFLAEYSSEILSWQRRAEVLEALLKETLYGADLHQISARAKSPDSLRLKILLKDYASPSTQVTDLLGARVITYYSTSVDHVAALLEDQMMVDERLDKRQELVDGRTFGYRSVHLVGKIRSTVSRDSRWSALVGSTFEIQVRSVLDHAWAEIEHELIYKSGVSVEVEVKRRFAAVAGTLEILEHEFLSLSKVFSELVDLYKIAYDNRRSLSEPLDAARLVAAFEVFRPHGLGWRTAGVGVEGGGTSVSPALAVRALSAVGVTSAGGLDRLLKQKRWLQRVESFASVEGIAPIQVSHVALTAICVGHKSVPVLEDYLPMLATSRGVLTALSQSANNEQGSSSVAGVWGE